MGVRVYLTNGIFSGLKVSKNLPKDDGSNDDYAPVPQEPVYELPTWISKGNLGTFTKDEEVAITLQCHDKSNVLEDFTLTGDLPTGLVFNDIGGTISGFIEDETSKTYDFTITMNTTYGDVVTESFSMSSLITETIITWRTESNLGVYDSGQNINQPIEALVEDKAVY